MHSSSWMLGLTLDGFVPPSASLPKSFMTSVEIAINFL